MTSKDILDLYNSLDSYSSLTFEDFISSRLDKILIKYISELDSYANKITANNIIKLIKEFE